MALFGTGSLDVRQHQLLGDDHVLQDHENRPAARADPEGDLVGAQSIEKVENDLALGLENGVSDL